MILLNDLQKKTGHQNSRTLKLGSRLNFGSLKGWFTVANYFFYKKILQRVTITQSSR